MGKQCYRVDLIGIGGVGKSTVAQEIHQAVPGKYRLGKDLTGTPSARQIQRYGPVFDFVRERFTNPPFKQKWVETAPRYLERAIVQDTIAEGLDHPFLMSESPSRLSTFLLDKTGDLDDMRQFLRLLPVDGILYLHLYATPEVTHARLEERQRTKQSLELQHHLHTLYEYLSDELVKVRATVRVIDANRDPREVVRDAMEIIDGY